MKFWKSLACLLCAGLAIPAVPLSAQASHDVYAYTVQNDGSLAVTCKDKNIVNAEIPAEIDGYMVTALAEDCFLDCTSLETVTFPTSIKKLNDSAFSGCSALDSITIPAHIMEIGSFVFEGCTSLSEIAVAPESTTFCSDNGVLYNFDKSLLIRYPAAKTDESYTVAPECRTIEPWCFTDCAYLQTLTMSEVNAIGADAFFYATALEEVYLSEGITELIGPSFAYCTSLKKVELPSTLKTIGQKCFYGCVNLQVIALPDGLETIGEMAFYGCVQMKELLVPSTVKEIGEMGIGYSVDPETNENTIIKDFKMKTLTGSKASNYARSNGIRYSAKATAGFITLWVVIAIAVLSVAAAIFIYYRRQERAYREALEQLAKKQEEKRVRRQERKKR